MKKPAVLLTVGLLILLCAQSVGYTDTPDQPIKWSQLPDMNRGLDYSTETKVPSIVADDFLCTNGLPITDIHWWGSYWVPPAPIPPNGSSNSDGFPNAQPGGIQWFVIRFWNDVPAGADPLMPFSHPGIEPLWTYYAEAYNEVFYGTTVAGADVYQYNVYLPPDLWFYQERDKIYWLSIEAMLPDPSKQWGWHESKDQWNDDAVQSWRYVGWPPGWWVELVNNTYSVDMAFELSTVPEPSSMAVLGFGLAGMAGWAVRRRK